MFITNSPVKRIELNVELVPNDHVYPTVTKMRIVTNDAGITYADFLAGYHFLRAMNHGWRVVLCCICVEGAVLVTEEERQDVED